MTQRRIEPHIIKLLRDKNNWIILEETAFSYDCLKGHGLENFKLTKRKKKKISVQFGAIMFNDGALGSTTFKDIFINWGIRKVGIIGTGEKSKLMRIQCPHCKKINKIFENYQKCKECNMKFYLLGNK